MDFLRDLDFDRTSFWLGFLAGFLSLWLLGRLRPLFVGMLRGIRERLVTARQSATAGEDVRLRNEALRQAQSMHIAAPLFPLDQLLITPRLLAPPVPVNPGETPPPVEITHLVLPYMPDAPEMAARYRAPTLTLAEALQNGVSLVVIGSPGSGKSVCLAHLASQMARRASLPGGLEKLTPVLLHAVDLSLPPSSTEAPLEPLLNAVGQSSSPKARSRLMEFLETSLDSGRVLLLLDGLDELPPADVDGAVAYLQILKERYPALRMVASAALGYYDGLARLGCIPLAMAGWDRPERAAFVQRWSESWKAVVLQNPDSQAAEPALINAWLIGNNSPTTPLEFALRTWAAYAGDQLGATYADAMEAYLRRMVYDKNLLPDPQARPALEKIALQMLLTNRPSLSQSELGVLPKRVPSAQITEAAAEQSASAEEIQEPVEQEVTEQDLPEVLKSLKRVKIGSVLPLLLENGLLVASPDNRLRFQHPALCGYLAGSALSDLQGGESLFSGKEWSELPGWDARIQAAEFAIACGMPLTSLVESHLTVDQAPLHRHLLSAARMLRYAAANVPWRSGLLRRLAAILQDTEQPLAMRARVMALVASSGTPGVQALLHQISQSARTNQRQLSALGAGLYYDENIAGEKSTVDSLISDLDGMLSDPAPNVRRAACLGLAAVGNRIALESVADALLVGDDELRQAAAEALANHPEEGYPTLREGTKIDDVMVRRAVIFGLQRVGQPWAVETLKKIQIEEEEWLVKNAATHALETLELPNPYLPRSHPPLTETAWLIEYAGEKGIGVSPGRPAVELLLNALQEGGEERVLAAMDYLRRYGDELAIPPLYQLLYNTQGEIQDAAFNTLWHLSAAGLKLPAPDTVLAA